MNPILPEPNRQDKLKGWLRARKMTYGALSKLLGMSVFHTGKLLNRDYATPARVARLRALGVPEELLPEAREWRPGRKPGRRPGPAGC